MHRVQPISSSQQDGRHVDDLDLLRTFGYIERLILKL